MKKKIAILGSTGSIGTTSLRIIETKKKLFNIEILSANKNKKKIEKQIKNFKPKIFIISNKKIFLQVKKKFKKSKIKIYENFSKINYRKKKLDITISAIPGMAGLSPTINFIKLSKKILLANKESIICGWDLIKNQSKKYSTQLVPIDSEHFSINELLKNNEKAVRTIFITASGGPFLYKKNSKNNIKPSDALKHPKWKMGKKISINSATMMNKLFELIEAKKIFDKFKNKLKIIIHPQSQIHAAIEYKNGLTHLLYHEPDMRIPISNAIFDSKLDIDDFIKLKKNKKIFERLEFIKINKNNFPPIKFLPILNKYVSLPIILNAANEILVDQFLSKKIKFNAIISNLYSILRDKNFKKYAIKKAYSIQAIHKIDNWARGKTLRLIKNI
tara:strand:- start:862 stop:2025 length:1164 start_codon:yes stop_codon:yes gene_type:complete